MWNREDAGLNCRNDALGMFGVLDCLEDIRRNFEQRLRFNGGDVCTRPAKHVNDFDSTASRFLQEDRSFDRKQALAREAAMPNGFP